jgi:hypothetical protein
VVSDHGATDTMPAPMNADMAVLLKSPLAGS